MFRLPQEKGSIGNIVNFALHQGAKRPLVH